MKPSLADPFKNHNLISIELEKTILHYLVVKLAKFSLYNNHLYFDQILLM